MCLALPPLPQSRPAAIMMLTGAPESVARQIAADSILHQTTYAPTTPEILIAQFYINLGEGVTR